MKNWNNVIFQRNELVDRYLKLLPIISESDGFTLVNKYSMVFLSNTKIYDHNSILSRIVYDICKVGSAFIPYYDEMYVLAMNDLGVVKYLRVHSEIIESEDFNKMIKFRENYHFKANYTNTYALKLESVFELPDNLIPSEYLEESDIFINWVKNKQPVILDNFIESLNVFNKFDLVIDCIDKLEINLDLSIYHNEIRDFKIKDILK